VRKSVFEVADQTVARRIVEEGVRRKLPVTIADGDAERPIVTITHREYERDAAEMLIRSVDPTARRLLDSQ
jgi:hypothetical protein